MEEVFWTQCNEVWERLQCDFPVSSVTLFGLVTDLGYSRDVAQETVEEADRQGGLLTDETVWTPISVDQFNLEALEEPCPGCAWCGTPDNLEDELFAFQLINAIGLNVDLGTFGIPE